MSTTEHADAEAHRECSRSNRHFLGRQFLLLMLTASVLLIVLGQTSPADLAPKPGLEGHYRLVMAVVGVIDGHQDALTVGGFLLLFATTFAAGIAAIIESMANGRHS